MDTATTPTREQALALFAEAAKGMTPADPPQKTLDELLAPYARALLQYRKDGYSIAQLIQILKAPRIGITLSEATLKKFLTEARRRAGHRGRKPTPAPTKKAPAKSAAAP